MKAIYELSGTTLSNPDLQKKKDVAGKNMGVSGKVQLKETSTRIPCPHYGTILRITAEVECNKSYAQVVGGEAGKESRVGLEEPKTQLGNEGNKIQIVENGSHMIENGRENFNEKGAEESEREGKGTGQKK